MNFQPGSACDFRFILALKMGSADAMNSQIFESDMALFIARQLNSAENTIPRSDTAVTS